MSTYSINDVTVKERILLHLAKYSNIAPGQEYNVPFDLTQDGIATVVGITRAHVSIDLKRLGEVGMVTNWQARQNGIRTKRLVYAILPPGMERAESVRQKLKDGGIDADILLDMKKCDPATKWNSLSDKDKEIFGKACVFRVPIPRDTFPPTETGTLPADIYGMTFVPRDVARVYLEKVSPETIRTWNSWAADWWIERDNPQERLFHLISAGRMLEAAKHAIRYKEEFSANPNEDLLDLLKALGKTEYRYEDLVLLKSQIAVSCKQLEDAKKLCKELDKLGSPMATIVEAQTHLLSENYEKAYGLAAIAYDDMHLPMAAIIMSQACVRMGDLKEADDLAVAACESMNQIGDARDIDEILKVRAEIAYKKGDRDSCYALLGKALAAAPEFKKEMYKHLMNNVQSPDIRVRFD